MGQAGAAVLAPALPLTGCGGLASLNLSANCLSHHALPPVLSSLPAPTPKTPTLHLRLENLFTWDLKTPTPET